MVRDNVRLVRRLSEGSMGEVWVAEHLGLRTEVAVKFIHSDLARKQPMMLERFEREAKAAAQLKSPYVVRTFDTGVMQDGTPFIVMELLEGQSLGQRLRRSGPLEPRLVCEVIVQVSRALSAAHEFGIVHRDIKPDNIFLVLGDNGVAKLLDFGIAKTATVSDTGTRLTHDGNLVGTPAYMSREQIMNSGEVDEQADLWALSVCAYEALTGRLPFEGSTIGLTCIAICEGELTPPSALVAGSSAELDAFFARAFDKEPAARFATAKELALALLLSFPQLAVEAERLQLAFEHSGKFSLPPPPLQSPERNGQGATPEPPRADGADLAVGRSRAALESAAGLEALPAPAAAGRWPRAAVAALAAAGVVVLVLVALLLQRNSEDHTALPAPQRAASTRAGQPTGSATAANTRSPVSRSRSARTTAAPAPRATRPKPYRGRGKPSQPSTPRPEDELGF